MLSLEENKDKLIQCDAFESFGPEARMVAALEDGPVEGVDQPSEEVEDRAPLPTFFQVETMPPGWKVRVGLPLAPEGCFIGEGLLLVRLHCLLAEQFQPLVLFAVAPGQDGVVVVIIVQEEVVAGVASFIFCFFGQVDCRRR